MTFKQIQDAVMADRFSEGKRSSIKDWINARYGRVWAREPWSFKQSVFYLTIPSGSSIALAENNITRVTAVYKEHPTYNQKLWPRRPEDFHEWERFTSGEPLDFTVINNNLSLDTPVPISTSITVVGELRWSPLVADGDIPLIPEEFHYMLVHGAASEGLRIENDPTWQGFEQDFDAYYEDMKKSFLSKVPSVDAYPAWPGW